MRITVLRCGIAKCQRKQPCKTICCATCARIDDIVNEKRFCPGSCANRPEKCGYAKVSYAITISPADVRADFDLRPFEGDDAETA